MGTLKKVWTYLVIALVAFVAAVNYELFVFPNQFAPSGINGICTMIQHLTGLSVGYMSLIINVPLALWCYIEVSKPMAIRSMVYVLVFSVGLLILDHVDLSAFAYGITGARALHTASYLGLAVHMAGGIIGIGIMLTLTIIGALHLLTPLHVMLYQLVWSIPGILLTEWTRLI